MFSCVAYRAALSEPFGNAYSVKHFYAVHEHDEPQTDASWSLEMGVRYDISRPGAHTAIFFARTKGRAVAVAAARGCIQEFLHGSPRPYNTLVCDSVEMGYPIHARLSVGFYALIPSLLVLLKSLRRPFLLISRCCLYY